MRCTASLPLVALEGRRDATELGEVFRCDAAAHEPLEDEVASAVRRDDLVEAQRQSAAQVAGFGDDLVRCEPIDFKPAALNGAQAGDLGSLVRALLGQACQALGDPESASMHWQAAASAFGQLGAAPDLARIERLMAVRSADPGGALTAREREVLSLVASGRTNRQVAAELGLSEHTVSRHLSNIFDKLDVDSRTAASAFAYRHGLA